MLPFLKKSYAQGGTVQTITRTPDHPEESESVHSDGLKQAARDLIDAVHSRDEGAVVSALTSAFQLLDSMPHEEGPHLEDDGE